MSIQAQYIIIKCNNVKGKGPDHRTSVQIEDISCRLTKEIQPANTQEFRYLGQAVINNSWFTHRQEEFCPPYINILRY